MYDTAVEQYKKALQMNPSLADAHYRLGLSYYEKKDYTSAKIHIEKAQKLGYKVDAKTAELLKLTP
jgi:tetratricopeptide (TPR) repeat protein